ncbi:MAG: RNA pyrophosphohydrolase [Pelagibacteraceae bacterium]|nr:RNA pyrophosphohydrolase [Pelagibacteraceae bacterium]|tara:strand:- start:889 stop:1359 length:471 start_codon:yes stop_codon:yes gene_type:complete
MNKNKKYRPNVGIMIINKKKEIFVGQRLDHPSHFWQMPQGGIDSKETALNAALRESVEETGIKKSNLKLTAETKDWHYYDLPLDLAKTLWNGKYIGQKQKWFLFEFLGTKKDINVNTKNPEFSEYKWVNKLFLEPNIVPFKRPIYKKILEEFKNYL